jgi:competence protein ComEC
MLRRAGPGLVLAVVVVGIVVGGWRGPGRAPGALLAVTAGAGVALLGLSPRASARRRVVAFVGLCVAAGCAGTAAMARALDGQVRTPLVAAAADRADVVVDATLVTDPTATRFAARGLARVTRARIHDGTAAGATRRVVTDRVVVVDASGPAAPRLGVLGAGDRVRLRGYLRPLDPYEEWARWRHAVAGIEARALIAVGPPASPLMRLANALRSRVLAGTVGVPEPQRALLAGFLLGDTTDLPEAVVLDFRASGLSHLVAVSGQNVAFVLALAGPGLRRGPRGVRLVVGLVVLVVFVTMTRAEPSVLRAATMAACAMVGVALGRPAAGLRSLALAVSVLLVVDPFLLHSVGFRLSCAASAGIAALAPAIAARVPGPRPVAEALGVTLAAQVAVAPLLVQGFGGVPLIAPVANLVVAPAAGPLTVLGLVGGAVGGIVGGALAAAVTLPAYLGASWVLLVAGWAARVPLTVGAGPLLVGGGAAATAVLVTRVGRRRADDGP